MRNPWKLTSFALAAALAGATLVPNVIAEPQPKMRAALDSLRAAQRSLEEATPDKGGHRVKAIQLTKQAIDEVEAGIKFDNKH
jgi:hypothetical protein